MSFYKELAQSTYDKLFVEGLHIPSGSIENLKLIIDEHTTLLSSQKELRLYIDALIQLIKVEKISVAQNQKLKYGYVILNKYDEILELYNWLNEVEYSIAGKATISKIDSLNWLGNQEQLEFLFNALIAKEFLKKDTDLNLFKALFLPGPKEQRVQWIHTNRLLDYLFKLLHDHSLIDCSTYQAVIDKNGLFKNKHGKSINANDLAAAKSNYIVGGPPHGSEIIEPIIENIKNIKSS